MTLVNLYFDKRNDTGCALTSGGCNEFSSCAADTVTVCTLTSNTLQNENIMVLPRKMLMIVFMNLF